MVKLNKTQQIILVSIGVVALMAGTIWGAVWVSNIDNRKAAAAYPKCEGPHATHKVVIQDDQVIPRHTDGQRCDILVINNLDNKPRIMAFGRHEKHIAYDGISERYLSEKGTFKVTLVQPGSFRFHDHADDSVQGTFSVR